MEALKNYFCSSKFFVIEFDDQMFEFMYARNMLSKKFMEFDD